MKTLNKSFSLTILFLLATNHPAHAQRTLDQEDHVYRSEHLRQMRRQTEETNRKLESLTRDMINYSVKHHEIFESNFYEHMLNSSRIQFVDHIGLSATFAHEGTTCNFGLARVQNAIVPRVYDKEFYYSVEVVKNESIGTRGTLALSLVPSDSDRETLLMICERNVTAGEQPQVSLFSITQAFNQSRPLISIYPADEAAPNIPDPVKAEYDPRKDPYHFKN